MISNVFLYEYFLLFKSQRYFIFLSDLCFCKIKFERENIFVSFNYYINIGKY